MTFYACGKLSPSTPQAILAGGCIRLEIYFARGRRFINHGFVVPIGANDSAHQGHFSMGTCSPWHCVVHHGYQSYRWSFVLAELRSGFLIGAQYLNTPPELVIQISSSQIGAQM